MSTNVTMQNQGCGPQEIPAELLPDVTGGMMMIKHYNGDGGGFRGTAIGIGFSAFGYGIGFGVAVGPIGGGGGFGYAMSLM